VTQDATGFCAGAAGIGGGLDDLSATAKGNLRLLQVATQLARKVPCQHTALKTEIGVASPSGRAAASTAAHGPALANQDRVSSQGLGQQTAAATKHASSSLDGPKTPVGALKDRSANGRKRSTAEATGASALGPSASKRPKTADAAGNPKQKAHAAMRPRAKLQQRAIVTARKGQCKEHLKALKVIKPAEEEDLPVHGTTSPLEVLACVMWAL